MKLYREVLIESAEQAEALPIGTVALDHPRGTRDDRIPYVKATPDRWASVWDVSALGNIKSYGTAPNEAMVGDRALVPIEAEEEWTAMGSDNGEPWIAHVGHDGIDGSREEAQQYVDRFGGFIAHRTRTPWEEAQ